MPFQSCPNIAQIQLIGRQDGQETINDLYFRTNVPPMEPVQMGNCLEPVCQWYANSIASYASSTWAFVRGHMRDLGSADGVTLDNSDFAVAGAVGGAAAPNNVSFAISFRCAIGGRSARGRNFIPGIPMQAVSGNTITSDFITNYIDAYSALLPGGGVLPENWAWVVLSRITAGALRPLGIGTACAAAIATDNIVDSARRRLPGRGA